jgi:hypothetical protein
MSKEACERSLLRFISLSHVMMSRRFRSGPLYDRQFNAYSRASNNAPEPVLPFFEFQYAAAPLSFSRLEMRFELSESIIFFNRNNGQSTSLSASVAIEPVVVLTVVGVLCDMVWHTPHFYPDKGLRSVLRQTSCVLPSALYDAMNDQSIQRFISVEVVGHEVRVFQPSAGPHHL